MPLNTPALGGNKVLDSQKISITLPNAMLEAIDRLASHQFNSRSGVIRQAVSEFLVKPENSYIVDPKKEITALKYEILREKYPYLNPHDAMMIDLLFEQRKVDKDEI